MDAVRGKFQVIKKAKVNWNADVEIVTLQAVCQDDTEENRRFHKYSPQGSIELTIDNPPASAALSLGGFFYVDFTPCPPK